MKKILMIVLAVVALQLGVVSATYASGGGDGGTYHKVHYGETLFSIGRQYDRHPYHIAEVNGLYNPNVIYAGQILYIPTGSRYPWEAHDGCGNRCDDGYGWQRSGQRDNCGWGDCGGSGWQRSGQRDNCGGGDCGGSGWQQSGWNNNCGWNNCDNSGWQRSGHRDNCGGGDCGGSGWQKSGWNNNCGWNNCDSGCDWNNCNNSGYQDKCGGNKCGSSYYGYDYTGYYYGNYQKRYSYSCGYYSNCW